MCTIPKNAKSVWLSLFRRLVDPTDPNYIPTNGIDIHSIHNYGIKKLAWLDSNERKAALSDPKLIR